VATFFLFSESKLASLVDKAEQVTASKPCITALGRISRTGHARDPGHRQGAQV